MYSPHSGLLRVKNGNEDIRAILSLSIMSSLRDVKPCPLGMTRASTVPGEELVCKLSVMVFLGIFLYIPLLFLTF